MTVSSERRNELSEGRLYFWDVAIRMANANPIFGVGHNAFTAAYNTYDQSGGQFGVNRAVHSSWMAVLADLGYPGLILFLANIGLCLAASLRAGRLAKRRPDLADLGAFASALGAGLIAFCVGGTFVNLQYGEALWHLTALSSALLAITIRAASIEVPAASRVPVPALTGLPRLGPRPAIASTRSPAAPPAPGRFTR